MVCLSLFVCVSMREIEATRSSEAADVDFIILYVIEWHFCEGTSKSKIKTSICVLSLDLNSGSFILSLV